MITKVPPMQCKVCETHNGKHTAGCALGFPPKDEVAALRAKVAMMREMGVLEADGIKLGAVPQPEKPEETEEEWKARMAKIAQRNHEIMFAASGTKPVLRGAKKA